MPHSVVIVGFEKDYSNQIRQLLEHSNAISSISIHSESDAGGCWRDNDIALINSHHLNYPRWLKNCLKSEAKRPPASLIIGDTAKKSDWHKEERRAAPRFYLSNEQLTGNNLIDAIQRLSSARYLPSIKPVENAHPLDDYYQEDSARYESITHSESQPALFGQQVLDRKKIFIGQYQLKQILGIGGIATVYRATAPNKAPVAIKLLDPVDLKDDRLLDRFIKEYELLETVNHPNIIRVYEQGFTDSHLYIAMQLLKKGSLKSRIQSGLTVEQAILYAVDISAALATIHDIGILHRDLKPNNILFDEAGRPVITDFGLAKIVQDKKEAGLTMENEAVGTPAYMSPEQVLGHEVTTSSDQYAFGIMLYRMLTGTLPFQAKSPIAMMRKQIESPPPHLPTDLMDLDPMIQRLLCKQPTGRYPSVWELHEELKQFMG